MASSIAAKRKSSSPNALEQLNIKAVAASAFYYDKEELERFVNLFGSVTIIDNHLKKFVSMTRELLTAGSFDDLPASSKQRKEKLIKLYDAKISAMSNATNRKSMASWFEDAKEYECDLELSQELLYRYCWADFMYKVALADKGDLPFADKLMISPVVPKMTEDKIKPLSDIVVNETEEDKKVFKTGISTIDDLVSMRKSNFNIVAARPSIGKSMFLYNLAINNALNEKVLYVSLEESEAEMRIRVDAHTFNLKDKEREKVLNNLFVFRPNTSNPDVIFGEVEKFIKEEGVEIVCIDYIQLLKYPDLNDWDSLRRLTREFKMYAVKNNILLLTASQIKREAEMVGASLSTLFGSSTIEADANVIIILESKRKQSVRIGNKNIIEANVAKNRSGAQGKVELEFDYSIGHITAM